MLRSIEPRLRAGATEQTLRRCMRFVAEMIST